MSSGVGRSETGACAAGGVARGAQVKVTLRARPPRHVAAERPSTGPVAHETLAASDNGALQQVTLGTAAALGTGNRRRRLRAAAFRWLRRWPRCRYRLRHRDLGHALPLRWGSRQLLPREQRLELCETAVHLHEVVAEPHERRLVLRSAGHAVPTRREEEQRCAGADFAGMKNPSPFCAHCVASPATRRAGSTRCVMARAFARCSLDLRRMCCHLTCVLDRVTPLLILCGRRRSAWVPPLDQ